MQGFRLHRLTTILIYFEVDFDMLDILKWRTVLFHFLTTRKEFVSRTFFGLLEAVLDQNYIKIISTDFKIFLIYCFSLY